MNRAKIERVSTYRTQELTYAFPSSCGCHRCFPPVPVQLDQLRELPLARDPVHLEWLRELLLARVPVQVVRPRELPLVLPVHVHHLRDRPLVHVQID